MPANVFVIGLDDRNRALLENLPDAEWCRFHGLLTIDELQHGEDIPLAALLDKAQRELESFDGSVDAVVSYWDFPASSMVPILGARFGLRTPTLESVLKCEDKYWSRLEQQKVTDAHPRFAVLDVARTDDPPPPLPFPFWLKPVKSFSSELAFKVPDEESYRRALAAVADGIGRVSEPFEFVLSHAAPPEEVAAVGATACVAEEVLEGHQATVEGYCVDGEVHVYGTVDSVPYPDSSSFLRYEYPSRLPGEVLERMTEVSRRVMSQIGLAPSAFNIEFFWDPEQDVLGILEINPRHSQSHAFLFEHVDGLANHHCMVRLALGRDPELPHGEGEARVAAKWFLRRFSDGVVRRAPTAAEVAGVEREVPGTKIDLVPQEGERLSDLHDQDSYSYELANIYVGADNQAELVEKYERCVELLPFEFDD